jgi:hypothetical protein
MAAMTPREHPGTSWHAHRRGSTGRTRRPHAGRLQSPPGSDARGRPEAPLRGYTIDPRYTTDPIEKALLVGFRGGDRIPPVAPDHGIAVSTAT